MKDFSWVVVSLMLVGCGSEETSETPAGTVDWEFDYRAFGSATPVIVGCENGEGEAISAVRVRLTVPGEPQPIFDATFGCAEGDGARASIREVSDGTYVLLAEALISDTVLYRLEDATFELRAGENSTLTLPAVVGELRFSPEVEGSTACPAELERIAVELFEVSEGTPADEATTRRFIDEPCEAGVLEPIRIEQVSSDLSGPLEYQVRFEATSAAETLACAAVSADVATGEPSPTPIRVNLRLETCP
ncbi:MAG: hypothetical protein AAFU77_01445 [Myxococcota bacterium]